MQVLNELRKVGRSLAPKSPPIPIALTGLGLIGHAEHRRGLYINSGIERHVRNLVKDHYRAERVAREISDGRLGAEDILPVVALGSDTRDAIRAIKSMTAAVASWNDIVNARANGKSWDYLGTKASQTTVANQWSSFLRTAGNPAAITYGAIPGPPIMDSNFAGAWPLPMALGASDNLYLTNFGQNHTTGTNITLVVDVLQAAGNISATIVTSQNVTTTALPRWTGGSGLNMTLEVTTAFGTATGIPNVTINYVDQSGNAAESTSAISIGATSLITGRMFPIQDGPMVRFNSGDYGCRSINQVTFSASSAGAGAACAAILYKPLLMVPTLSTTSWVERSTPAQIGGIRQLTEVVQGSKPCIGFFVLTSTTSTGVMNFLIETVWG